MILLPREHFSWYQLDLWEKSKERYREEYFEDKKKKFTNAGMEIGKKMADALESVSLSGDIMLDIAMITIPHLEVRDKPFLVPLQVGKDTVNLWIQPDSYSLALDDVLEYKTSQTPWTHQMVANHGQIKFYAVGIWNLKKVMPRYRLVDIRTEKINPEDPRSKLVATGEFQVLNAEIKLIDIIKMKARISKAVKEISAEYNKLIF
jgi:hypothetical protein